MDDDPPRRCTAPRPVSLCPPSLTHLQSRLDCRPCIHAQHDCKCGGEEQHWSAADRWHGGWRLQGDAGRVRRTTTPVRVCRCCSGGGWMRGGERWASEHARLWKNGTARTRWQQTTRMQRGWLSADSGWTDAAAGEEGKKPSNLAAQSVLGELLWDQIKSDRITTKTVDRTCMHKCDSAIFILLSPFLPPPSPPKVVV